MDICNHAMLLVLTVSCKKWRQLAAGGGDKIVPVLDSRGAIWRKKNKV